MSPKIKVLDQLSVNQIAAGEVVERPLSVIKELIENSLDAQAQKIEISVEGGGDSFLKVKDDGGGIQPDDLSLAILPHATSKISSIVDLNTLETLGFRGEALPSIASVSRLSILSRPAEVLSGTEIEVEGGKFVSITEKGCSAGTTVTVRDLFFNTPARQKFLRSNNAEFGLISDMVSRLALARPDVAFTLLHPQNIVLNTPGKGNLLETIAAVLGNTTARKMVPVNYEDSQLKISGYISSPDYVRSSMNNVTFLVNGRVIRSQLLNQALKEGYYTFIHGGTYPLAVLALTMSPGDYDVNVHPAKLEIKFKEEKEISLKIAEAIRKALLADRPFRSSSIADQPLRTSPVTADINVRNQMIKETKSIQNPQQDWNQLKILYAPRSEGDVDEQLKTRPEEDKIHDLLPSKREREIVLFEELRAIGQVFNTYILCTNDRSLYVLDQHAAHERIKYDQLRTKLKNTEWSSQLLLIPETIDLSVQEESMLLEHFTTLRDLGFILEHFGERTYFLRGIPILQNLENPGKLFRAFLEEIITNHTVPKAEVLLEEWIFTLACRSAIKAKERLSLPEMDELIQQLGTALNPYTCPHGRPTIIEISRQELEKRFKRQ